MKNNRLKNKKKNESKKSVSVSNINHTINLKGRIIRWGSSKSLKKILIQVCFRAARVQKKTSICQKMTFISLTYIYCI